MSPLLPKGKRPWQDDPGHIHDAPAPAAVTPTRVTVSNAPSIPIVAGVSRTTAGQCHR